jgi:hypothetical protein
VGIDRQKLPGARHATQLDAAAVLEPGARADNQVAHGARDQDVASLGLAENARRNVYGEPPMSLSSSSHSPVWMPMRTSMPNVSASARKPSAQRMACVGPANVARSVLRPGASPTVSTASRLGVRQRRHFGPLEPCRALIRDAVQALGIEVRAGLHTGECEVRAATTSAASACTSARA